MTMFEPVALLNEPLSLQTPEILDKKISQIVRSISKNIQQIPSISDTLYLVHKRKQ
jgi:hypothetical protein